MFLLTYATCLGYLIFRPALEMAFEDEELSSPDAPVQAREMIVDFVVHGMMVDPPETKL